MKQRARKEGGSAYSVKWKTRHAWRMKRFEVDWKGQAWSSHSGDTLESRRGINLKKNRIKRVTERAAKLSVGPEMQSETGIDKGNGILRFYNKRYLYLVFILGIDTELLTLWTFSADSKKVHFLVVL